MENLNRRFLFACLVYFISLVFIGYYSVQNQFESILIPSAAAFISFLTLFKSINSKEKLNSVLGLIIFVKLCIFFSFPHLSDDIYRFWWDGFLSCNGFNPYKYSPTEILSQIQDENIIRSLQKNYSLLNSARYHTVYPLVCQWIFRISASISGDNMYAFNLILKTIFLVADGLILFLLLKLSTLIQL